MSLSKQHEQHKTPRHAHLLEWIHERTSQLDLQSLEQYFLFLKDHPNEAFPLIDAIERYSPSSISQLIQASKDENFPVPVLIHQEQKVAFINKATLELGGLSDSHDIIGHHILSFIPKEDHELMTSRMMHLIKTGVSSDPIAQRIRFPGGTEKTVIIYGMLTTFEDKPAVQIFFQQVSKPETKALEKEQQLSLSEGLNKALIQLVSDEKTEIVIPSVMNIARESFEADRVYIFKNFLASGNVLFTAQKYELVDQDVTSQIDNEDLEFVSYDEMGFQRWATVLGGGDSIYGNVDSLPECEQELLLSQDIKSILIVPIITNEIFWGFLGLDACKWQRPWSAFERSTLKSLGLAIGGYMTRMGSLDEKEASDTALQKAQELGNISSCTYFVETGSWYFSDSFRKTFGPVPVNPSLFHETGRKVLPLKDYEKIFREWDSLLRSNQRIRIEGELLFTPKEAESRYVTYLLENETHHSETTQINAIFRDITDEKLARLEVLRSQQKLERTQKIGKVGFWEFDFLTQKVWASNILYDMLALQKQEQEALFLLNQSIIEQDIHELVQKVELAISQDTSFEIIQRIQLKSGRTFFFEIYGEITKDENGTPSKLSGTCKDITEKEDTEQRFKTTNINFSAILESTEDLIFSLDNQFCITAYNSSFSALIKERSGKKVTIGVNLLQILSTAPLVKTLNSQINTLRKAMTGIPVVDYIKVAPPSESERAIYYEISINPIRGENNEARGVSVFGKDISLQIEKENEIRSLNTALEKKVAIRTEALEKTNKELESFAYSVSHDLRTPLRHLNGYSSLLKSRGQNNLDNESLEYLEFIETSSKKMNKLIEDLLEYSRLGRKELNKSEIPLHLIVDGLVDYFQSQYPEAGTEFTFDLEKEIFADHILVETILTNLISNAIKYRKTGQKAQVHLYTKPVSGGVHLTITDQGIGFDMKYIEQVFGIFKRLHTDEEYEGSGIGLANVARIMHRHGGSIEAHSERGQGATFTCFFPDSTFF